MTKPNKRAKFTGDPKTTSLDDAKVWLRQHVEDGAECPCCTQYARVYKRKLNSTMAACLIWIVRRAGSGRQWIEVAKVAPKWVVRTNQWATLRHWELVEQQPGPGTNGARSTGIWRPTHKGLDFVHNRISVPSHVLLYDNRRLGYDGSTTITEALGERFDYKELMSG